MLGEAGDEVGEIVVAEADGGDDAEAEAGGVRAGLDRAGSQQVGGRGHGRADQEGEVGEKLRRLSSTWLAERVVSHAPSHGSMMAEAPTVSCSWLVSLASS